MGHKLSKPLKKSLIQPRQILSDIDTTRMQPIVKPVNYDCHICMQSGNPPNILGRFHIISDTECKCNGCNAIFNKSSHFSSFVDDASLYVE